MVNLQEFLLDKADLLRADFVDRMRGLWHESPLWGKVAGATVIVMLLLVLGFPLWVRGNMAEVQRPAGATAQASPAPDPSPSAPTSVIVPSPEPSADSGPTPGSTPDPTSGPTSGPTLPPGVVVPVSPTGPRSEPPPPSSSSAPSTHPALRVNPSPVVFGAVLMDTASAPQTVIVQSIGTAPVSLTKIWTEGPFVITASTCPGSLAPGATCTITLVERPDDIGPLTGRLHLDGTLPQSVPISGQGLLSMMLMPIPFGQSTLSAQVGTPGLVMGSANGVATLTPQGSWTGHETITRKSFGLGAYDGWPGTAGAVSCPDASVWWLGFATVGTFDASWNVLPTFWSTAEYPTSEVCDQATGQLLIADAACGEVFGRGWRYGRRTLPCGGETLASNLEPYHGKVYVASSTRGLLEIDEATGAYRVVPTPALSVNTVYADPQDGTLWLGDATTSMLAHIRTDGTVLEMHDFQVGALTGGPTLTDIHRTPIGMTVVLSQSQQLAILHRGSWLLFPLLRDGAKPWTGGTMLGRNLWVGHNDDTTAPSNLLIVDTGDGLPAPPARPGSTPVIASVVQDPSGSLDYPTLIVNGQDLTAPNAYGQFGLHDVTSNITLHVQCQTWTQIQVVCKVEADDYFQSNKVTPGDAYTLTIGSSAPYKGTFATSTPVV